MNISEQIKSFEAKRAALAASLDEVMSKAAEEGRTWMPKKKRATTIPQQKLNPSMLTLSVCMKWKTIWHLPPSQFLRPQMVKWLS